MSYVIGSWYRSDELGRRSGIFQAAASLGVMISGYLAAAVYKLDKQGGFAGWQW
jgi:MFS transporter, ACS family, pantothenate transporter